MAINRQNSKIFMGGLFGGIAGALIAEASRPANFHFYTVTSIPNITKTKKQPLASVIDMRTGELSF